MEVQIPVTGVTQRLDVGMTFDGENGVPLFKITDENITGETYVMLHQAGYGHGSVTIKETIDESCNCQTVIYPTLTHTLKSLYHRSYGPATLKPLRRFCTHLESLFLMT